MEIFNVSGYAYRCGDWFVCDDQCDGRGGETMSPDEARLYETLEDAKKNNYDNYDIVFIEMTSKVTKLPGKILNFRIRVKQINSNHQKMYMNSVCDALTYNPDEAIVFTDQESANTAILNFAINSKHSYHYIKEECLK